MTSTNQLRALVADACRILDEEGHGDFALGHVSARAGDGILIKSSGMALGETTPDDVALVLTDGKPERFDARLPEELPLHLALYARRTDVEAVVHTHAPSAVVLSHDPGSFFHVSPDALPFMDGLPVYPHADLISTIVAGAAVAETLGPSPAILLRGHGLVAVGASVQEATVNAVQLERAARSALLAQSARIGEAAPAPDTASAVADAKARRAAFVDSTWDHLGRLSASPDAAEGWSSSGVLTQR
jgi:ribulose-5-phosphate 4-epimerase/fuculose-1-phosphate aldolase